MQSNAENNKLRGSTNNHDWLKHISNWHNYLTWLLSWMCYFKCWTATPVLSELVSCMLFQYSLIIMWQERMFKWSITAQFLVTVLLPVWGVVSLYTIQQSATTIGPDSTARFTISNLPSWHYIECTASESMIMSYGALDTPIKDNEQKIINKQRQPENTLSNSATLTTGIW